MKSFGTHLTEDAALDAVFRNQAELAYRNIATFVTDKLLDDKLDKYFVRRSDGSYGTMATDIGAPLSYSDLILIFTKKVGPNAGSFGFFEKQPVIFLGALTRDLNSIDIPRNVFVHEFVHYLDYKRYKNKAASQAHRFSTGEVTIDQYVNNPAEFNAYYQEVTDSMEFALKRSRDKSGLMRWFGTSVSDFVNRADIFFPSFFYDNLNSEYKRKLQKRLYSFYLDRLVPISKESR